MKSKANECFIAITMFSVINVQLTQYLIKWEDYDDSENTWEPAKQMKQDCPDLVKQFELEHEKKSDRGKTEDEDQTVEAVKGMRILSQLKLNKFT